MDLRKRNIVVAIMVAMFLGAVEGTVVTTAIPTIVRELNGFELISWVFSLYLLTSAITTPIYGKLSDLFGRKNILSIGIFIFLIGSSLCGLSRNMYQLVAFRAVQGLGAGAIFTVTYTIVGDVFSLEERAKVQGWVSAVWGIASLTGPFLGGFLIDSLSWHWIFFINIPFGILSIFLLQKNLTETFERKKHKIDYAGAVILSAAIIFVLQGVLGGNGSWHSLSKILFLVATVILFTAFYFIEKRVAEPLIPFEIFTPVSIMINVISFLVSAILIGSDVYMPIYIQNVLGYGATISGLVMAPMSISWLLSSVFLGKAIPRYGEKIVIAVSLVVLLISCVLLPTLGTHSSLLLVIAFAFIMGFGFGGAFTTLTITVQEAVEYRQRGVATASNSLLRTLGQTIGVSTFGSLFNINIAAYFEKLGIKGVKPDNLYNSSNKSIGVSAEHISAALNSALHIIFIVLIFIVVACIIISLVLPGKIRNRETADS